VSLRALARRARSAASAQSRARFARAPTRHAWTTRSRAAASSPRPRPSAHQNRAPRSRRRRLQAPRRRALRPRARRSPRPTRRRRTPRSARFSGTAARPWLRELSVGSKSTQVADWQRKLVRIGYGPLEVDAWFGQALARRQVRSRTQADWIRTASWVNSHDARCSHRSIECAAAFRPNPEIHARTPVSVSGRCAASAPPTAKRQPRCRSARRRRALGSSASWSCVRTRRSEAISA
jgi:hypothetical protein